MIIKFIAKLFTLLLAIVKSILTIILHKILGIFLKICQFIVVLYWIAYMFQRFLAHKNFKLIEFLQFIWENLEFAEFILLNFFKFLTGWLNPIMNFIYFEILVKLFNF